MEDYKNFEYDNDALKLAIMIEAQRQRVERFRQWFLDAPRPKTAEQRRNEWRVIEGGRNGA